MGFKPILNFSSFNVDDLTTPSSSQKYPLGMIIPLEDEDTKAVKKFMYVKSHAALTQYQPYVIDRSSVSGSEVLTASAITLASAVNQVCVPQVAFTSGYYGFVQIEGAATALVDAASTATHRAQLYTSGTSLSSTGATTKTVNTCATVVTTTTEATSTAVELYGFPVEVQST